MNATSDGTIKDSVRQTYGEIARQAIAEDGATPCCCAPRQATDCCGPAEFSGTCCAETPTDRSADPQSTSGCACPGDQFYAGADLSGLPASVTGASLGCGNPTAIADLKPGEVVLDLGSGGGIDCFLAAKQVGSEGRVIGLDMTPNMVTLARRNAKKLAATNVEFRFGEIEDIPLPEASVDAVISNCVINLSPDKDAVFGEVYRVLRPGGRISVSDIVTEGEMPGAVRERLDLWASCVAGALEESDYIGRIRSAGFEQVEVESRAAVADSACCGDEVAGEDRESAGSPGWRVLSIRVKGRKPG